MALRPGTNTDVSLTKSATGRGLLLTSLALLAIGVIAVTSATASLSPQSSLASRKDFRHLIFAIAAAAVVCVGWRIDYRRFIGLAGDGLSLRRNDDNFSLKIPTCLLIASLVFGVLVFVPGLGHAVGGRARWLRIGPAGLSIGFQPSELIKFSLVIFLSAWLSRPGLDAKSFRTTFLPAIGLIGLCGALVITQDFGTAAIIGVSGAVVLFLAGVRWQYLAGLALAGGAAGYAFIAGSSFRAARVAAMFDPWSLENPSSYQPRQSLLAVISGGIFGKGLGNGMIKRGFLPEGQTDFIFATFCEEWGLIGAISLLALLGVWLVLAGRGSVGASDKFGRLLCGSLGLMIGLQAILHIAVDLVVAPPTGLSLPFISYGGTALMVASACAALMISVCVRQADDAGLPS